MLELTVLEVEYLPIIVSPVGEEELDFKEATWIDFFTEGNEVNEGASHYGLALLL